MKNKLKRILGVITAISLLLQMSFVITSNAAEYFSLDFESATDTRAGRLQMLRAICQ